MLLKAKGVKFTRTSEDGVIVKFLGENKDEVIMTMDERFIEPYDSYILYFGSTLVIMREDFPDVFEPEQDLDRYFNER